MNRPTILLLLAIAAFVSTAYAETNTVRSTENRFLFIVETSSEMKKSATTARQSLSELIQIGLGGSMQDGDTFGIWTFNEELHAGKFPVQTWNATNATNLSRQVDAFLKQQKFEKTARLDKVVTPMFGVLRSSPTLTVIFLTTGTKPMAGTPFDREINEFYKANYKELQKQKHPFLTMLLSQQGKILRYSVSSALGDVKIAKPLPPLTITAPAPKPTPPAKAIAKPAPPPAATTNQALIITGTGSHSVNTNEVDAKLEELSAAKKQADAVAAAESARAAPPEPVSVKTPVAPEPLVELKPVPVNEPPKPVSPEPVVAIAATNTTPTNSIAAIEPKPSVAPPSPEPPPAPSGVSLVAPPTPPVPPEAPKPMAEVTPQAVDKSTTVTPDVESPAQTSVATQNAPVTPIAPTPVPVAVVEHSDTSPSSLFLIAGILLVIAALVIAYLLGRQSSRRSGPSLITDSMERKR